MHGRPAFGITLPLVTKTDGTKFGKTESGTIWLDPAKTSAYEMYQFWLNTADADVVRFLRYFTFLPVEDIAALAEATRQAPEKREAQRLLARDVTALVHGEAAMREAEAIGAALFSGDVGALSEAQLDQATRGMPVTVLQRAEAESLGLADLLVRVGLADSKRVARELLSGGGVAVNGRRVEGVAGAVGAAAPLYGKYLILRKGKKTYHAVILER
jgi:tyrosyl-tRNA synthetase